MASGSGGRSGCRLCVELRPLQGKNSRRPGLRYRRDARKDIGQPYLRIDVVEAVMMRVIMVAACSAPRSESANSHDFLSRANSGAIIAPSIHI